MSRSERGSVAIQLGLMLIVILGMVALGVEITFVLFKHRQMQSAADSAALGGATALMRGYPADFRMEARAIAAAAGFVNGVDNVTVTVNRPPHSGSYTDNNNAVEVIVSQPQDLGLVSLFREGLFQVGAHAVALIGNASLYCILALDPTATQAVYLQNNAVAGNPGCGIAVNSDSDAALYLRNNASIKGPVSVHGNWYLANNATLTGSPVTNHAATTSDPYADVALQTVPSCIGDPDAGVVGNNEPPKTLSPGHYCNGWTFGNSATVTLDPGEYYVDSMNLGNNLTLSGTDVTLIINGDYDVHFHNGAKINITAPKPGEGLYPGMAIMGRRDADPSKTVTFDNDTNMTIEGVIYFPNQMVEFYNNLEIPNGCTQVIARIVRFYNNVNLEKNCDNPGVKPIASTASQLVE